jgi:hypothetical protein
MREGQGILDGRAHVGGGELREDRAVDALDEAVDDGLRVDDGGEAIRREAEEP